MVNEMPDIPKKAKFSVKETAKILNVSKTSLYRYIKDGFIKANVRMFNNRIYFTGGEIMRFWGSELN